MTDTFDRELSELLKVLKKTMDDKNTYGLVKKENLIAKYLARYTKAYTKYGADVFMSQISDVYQKHRRQMMTASTPDAWLMENTVEFQYVSEKSEPDTTIRAMVSTIYRTAKKMEEEMRDSMGEAMAAELMSPKMKYPKQILLHLYRVFYEVEPTKGDREFLQKWITDLEVQLSLKDEDDKESGASDANPFGNLMSAAMPMIQNLFPSLPKGDKGMPSANQLMGMASSLLNDEKLGKTLSTIGTNLQECKSVESAFTTTFAALKESKIFDQIQSMMPAAEEKSEEEIPALEEA